MTLFLLLMVLYIMLVAGRVIETPWQAFWLLVIFIVLALLPDTDSKESNERSDVQLIAHERTLA